MSEIRIGCSGYQYKHWSQDFYPADVPQKRWLEHYATVFDSVEINNTFYRLPESRTFEEWRSRVPDGFVFAIKGSRYLTHRKRLKDPQEPVERLMSRAAGLGDKLGIFLFQLPPNWKANPERLTAFLGLLPSRHRHTVEFRDPDWYRPEVLETLRRHGVALCLHDMGGSESPREVTADFVYVRFHGVRRYGGNYPHQRLSAWAGWLAGQVQAGRDVYAYFNNDIGGYAPRNAQQLRRYLEERAS